MATAASEPAGAPTDPLYRKGLAHLQAGEWQEAIRCFEELLKKYPGDPTVRSSLEAARLRAGLDAQVNVRARRFTLPMRWLVPVLIVLAIAALAFEGWQILQRQVAPVIASAQGERRLAELLKSGAAYADAENFDAAEAAYRGALSLAPANQEAIAGLARIEKGRQILTLYTDGVRLQEAGDLEGALQKFSELAAIAPGYRDATQRVTAIHTRMDIDGVFAAAEADYKAGRYDQAIIKYEQIREMNASYKRADVEARLFELYMQRARAIVTSAPPQTALLPNALDDFGRAVALQPRNSDAINQQWLLSTFLAGQSSYTSGQWDDTIAQLRGVYDRQPGYMGDKLINPLYDAYIHSGDAYRDVQDYAMAWEQYRRAAELPVADTALARARMESVRAMITPTATPTNTPTPTLIPTATPYIYVPPTPLPSATPPAPLSTYRNRILFWSNNEEQPGLWLMNADGTNRRYLGDSLALRREYDALYARESYSPDGRFRVYVTTPEGQDPKPQIFIQGPKDAKGNTPNRQITHSDATCYDPVYSPNGSRVAYVGQESGSDDIWIVGTDGKDPRDLTPNKWEWDKHPSWSPDGGRIVFWSNRDLKQQIYVMNADGREAHNISNKTWDEYDPLWVK